MHDTTGNVCLKQPIPRLFQDSGPSTNKKHEKKTVKIAIAEKNRAQRNTTPHKYENIQYFRLNF